MTTPEQYAVPPLPERKASGSVVALGVISIIYAVLFRLCCGVVSLLSGLFASGLVYMVSDLPQLEGAPGQSLEMMSSGPMKAYTLINGFVLLVLGGMLLAGGIGLLKLRPWARILSLGAAAAEIVWVLISFVINIFFINPMTIQVMPDQGPEASQMVGGVIVSIFVAFAGLVYPIVLLICLNLTSIKGQFEPDSVRY